MGLWLKSNGVLVPVGGSGGGEGGPHVLTGDPENPPPELELDQLLYDGIEAGAVIGAVGSHKVFYSGISSMQTGTFLNTTYPVDDPGSFTVHAGTSYRVTIVTGAIQGSPGQFQLSIPGYGVATWLEKSDSGWGTLITSEVITSLTTETVTITEVLINAGIESGNLGGTTAHVLVEALVSSPESFPGPWTGVTYKNGWVDYTETDQGVQYRLNGDTVEMRGAADSGVFGFGNPMFTFPAGLTPPENVFLAAMSIDGTNSWCAVRANGDCEANGTDNQLFSVTGMSFSVTP
jgi:hypothetical protein